MYNWIIQKAIFTQVTGLYYNGIVYKNALMKRRGTVDYATMYDMYYLLLYVLSYYIISAVLKTSC